MKEIIIKTFNTIYESSPLKVIINILPEAAYHLVLAAQLWFITLSLYFSVVITAVFLSILAGSEDFINCLVDFTRAYFYDGTFLGFVAWRIHLTIYAFCVLLTFND